jgi:hypothetical protein
MGNLVQRNNKEKLENTDIENNVHNIHFYCIINFTKNKSAS